MNAPELISRLDDAALKRLATLTIDSLLDQTVLELLPEDFAKRLWRVALEGWVQSPQAMAGITRLVETAANDLKAQGGTLREAWPSDAKATARELLSRPWSPDRQLVMTIIDRPPVRELVRALLLDTVLEFARRASAPVAGVAKGLGSLAKMAASTAKSRGGALGSLVGAVSGAVSGEVEKRAGEVVDAALGGVFGEIADAISNPRRAGEAAELRLAIFDGVLELTHAQLARELMNLDVPGGADIVRSGITRWLASPRADAAIAEVVQRLAEREGKRTVRQVLEESGQLQTARTLGEEALAARMKTVVTSEPFEAWLTEVLAARGA